MRIRSTHRAWWWLAFVATLGGCDVGDRRNLLTAQEPARVISFELKEPSGAILWRIASDHPRALSDIRYGVVPSGFTQETPAGGVPPRPLRDHEELVALTDLEDRVLEHGGHAVGVDGFEGGGYLSTPKKWPRQ